MTDPVPPPGSDSSSGGSPGMAHAPPSDSIHSKIVSNPYAKQATGIFSPGYDEPLCGCFSDPTGCALVTCCPCVPLAALKANVDNRHVTLMDFLCCPHPYQLRQSIRAKFSIPYAPFNDAGAIACCLCCSIHQDVREFAKRESKPPQFMMFD